MYEALLELMEPFIQQRDQENIKKGVRQGIRVSVDMLRELVHEEAEIKSLVMRKYKVPAEEVDGYL